MHHFRFLSCWVTLAVIVGITSCKVEGPEGPAGRDGEDGNANVKTQIITVTPSNWSGDGYIREAQKQCSIITAGIVESGAVLCYVQQGTNTYAPVPFSYTDGYLDENNNVVYYNSHTFYMYSPGVISFLIQDDDGMTPAPTSNLVFKVVAIASSEVVAGINTLDYNEVARALQLED